MNLNPDFYLDCTQPFRISFVTDMFSDADIITTAPSALGNLGTSRGKILRAVYPVQSVLIFYLFFNQNF